MNMLWIATLVVALAEMGDKTQLLAFILAARFQKPIPIILGILVATVLNHGLAGALGAWITTQLSPNTLRWIIGLLFIGMSLWTLIPDKMEEDHGQDLATQWGVFGATFVTFFLAEMGDKTQIATIGLAVKYDPLWVVIGTTLGMLIADVPAVFVGQRFANRIPMKWVHGVAAAIFLLLGIITLMGDSSWLHLF